MAKLVLVQDEKAEIPVMVRDLPQGTWFTNSSWPGIQMRTLDGFISIAGPNAGVEWLNNNNEIIRHNLGKPQFRVEE